MNTTILRFFILECTIKNWLLENCLLRITVSTNQEANSQFLFPRLLDKSFINKESSEILYITLMVFII